MPVYAALPTPQSLKERYPLSGDLKHFVQRARQTVRAILRGEDPRFLIIVGPCSIHDTTAAHDYAIKLRTLAAATETTLYIAMRVHCEKSRTADLWRGFLHDPHLDGSSDIAYGLKESRRLFLELTALGIPTATELLDPCVIPYLCDLPSWGCIGARTATSQIHRLMASGMPMPVAFKNSLDGNVNHAIMGAAMASKPQRYPGINEMGQLSLATTQGNLCTHIALRGGERERNSDLLSIESALLQLTTHGLFPGLLVDCSHDNSRREPQQQVSQLYSLIDMVESGLKGIRGAVLESHLQSGRQPINLPLSYGISITDACLGWNETEELLIAIHHRLETIQRRPSGSYAISCLS